jgi:hypothetical protein
MKPRNYGPEFGILGLPYVFLVVIFVTNFIPPIFSFYMFGRELDFQKRSPMRTRYFFYTLILAYVHYYYFILERKFSFKKLTLYKAVNRCHFVFHVLFFSHSCHTVLEEESILLLGFFCTEPGFETLNACKGLRSSTALYMLHSQWNNCKN